VSSEEEMARRWKKSQFDETARKALWLGEMREEKAEFVKRNVRKVNRKVRWEVEKHQKEWRKKEREAVKVSTKEDMASRLSKWQM